MAHQRVRSKSITVSPIARRMAVLRRNREMEAHRRREVDVWDMEAFNSDEGEYDSGDGADCGSLIGTRGAVSPREQVMTLSPEDVRLMRRKRYHDKRRLHEREIEVRRRLGGLTRSFELVIFRLPDEVAPIFTGSKITIPIGGRVPLECKINTDMERLAVTVRSKRDMVPTDNGTVYATRIYAPGMQIPDAGDHSADSGRTTVKEVNIRELMLTLSIAVTVTMNHLEVGVTVTNALA